MRDKSAGPSHKLEKSISSKHMDSPKAKKSSKKRKFRIKEGKNITELGSRKLYEAVRKDDPEHTHMEKEQWKAERLKAIKE